MSLWNKLTGEFVDIVEWIDDSSDTLVCRFPRYQNEIKYGAKLVVREGQVAAFINQGKLADVFQPGMYTLDTSNLPILSTLMGWKYGFNSPFKAEVYFASTRLFTDLKWGTQNPIMLRDPEFGPIRLRAFGSYVIRVKDVSAVIRQLSGTDGRFTTADISNQLRNFIVSRFADIIGESKLPALDMAANYEALGKFITDKIKGDFERYGLELDKLLVENISLPPEVEQMLDKRTSMGIVGNLGAFTQFQVASSIPDAAKNPGGLAAAGAGLGLGVGLAGQVSQAMAPQAPVAPPPLPQAVTFFAAINGQQAGPFDANPIQIMTRSNQISRETLVWRQGMLNWTAAGQVPELASVFAQVPPPLPKA